MYRHAVVITPVARWVLIARGTVYCNRFHSSPATAAFPQPMRGRRPHLSFRGLLDVHACYGLSARRVAMRPVCLEGSDGFVTSTAAPIATGWSDPVAGWELHPLKTNTFPRRTLVLTTNRPFSCANSITVRLGDGSLIEVGRFSAHHFPGVGGWKSRPGSEEWRAIVINRPSVPVFRIKMRTDSSLSL